MPAVAGAGAARLLRWRPPRVALGLALGALAAHVAWHGVAAPYGQAPLAGAALAAAGVAWMAWAWACFRVAGTPIRPTDAPRVLVDHGPFALGRNPMYLGIAATLVGLALALGVPLLALAAAGFTTIVARVHVPHEEAALKRAFGGWYSDYAAQVRRWI
ncbi:MAG: isoprenylcysteine carboxylmethyltransferase family protein [Rubrivivax sp.]|nr:isoprenylcysteine carboxylmethyltransferase family protein [Rubrivivax sp.]